MLLLLLWLVGCDVTLYANLPVAPLSSVPDDSGTPTVSTGPTGSAPYEGPPVIERWSVDCPDPTTVRLSVDSAGWTNGIALAYLIETVDPEPWDEEHPVPSVERDAEPRFERHLVDLADQASPTWESGVSTRFDCATNVSAASLTWVFRIYDEAGALADCIAFGHDPWGVVLGAYLESSANGGPSAADELAACAVVRD